MDDDPNYESPPPPVPASKPSKVPSWIMLGFAFGALFVWSLREPAVDAPVKVVEVIRPAPQPPKLTQVEAVFEAFRTFAVWQNDDSTEIAFWNSDTHDYTDFFEVRRIGSSLYFRSIPRLNGHVLNYGERLPAESPIRFTAPADVTESTQNRISPSTFAPLPRGRSKIEPVEKIVVPPTTPLRKNDSSAKP
ncbi:MAG: hypothetical protein RIQ93_1527 [Verrucomicrobiota bacterium]